MDVLLSYMMYMRTSFRPAPSLVGPRHNLLHLNMSHPGKSGIVSALTWVCRRCHRPHPPPGLRNPNKQSLLLVADVRVKPSPRSDSPDDSRRLETTRGRSRRLGNSDDVITAVVESPARSQGPAVRRPARPPVRDPPFAIRRSRPDASRLGAAGAMVTTQWFGMSSVDAVTHRLAEGYRRLSGR